MTIQLLRPNTWYIPAESTEVTTNLELPANSRLIVDGILRQAAGATASLIHVAGSNVVIEGCGIIDGNATGTPVGRHNAGVDTAQVEHVRIRDLTITNCSGWPVNIMNSSADVQLVGLTLTDSGAAPEFANGCQDCWADRIKVSNIRDYGFCFYGGVTRSGLTNSVLENCFPCCGVLSDDAQPAPCSDILIANVITYVNPNVSTGNVEACFVTDNTTSQMSKPQRVRVIGCTFDGGSPLSGGQAGATETFTCLIRGANNEFSNNLVCNSRAEWALEIAKGNTYSNNVFLNNRGGVKVS